MSRVIKFRAWDKFNACMWKSVDSLGLFFTNMEELQKSGNGIVYMQFTGLHDKNGVEVYEGDILGGIYEGGHIEYCNKCKGFQYNLVDFGCMACEGDVFWQELAAAPHEVEVIGNIHENPELINK